MFGPKSCREVEVVNLHVGLCIYIYINILYVFCVLQYNNCDVKQRLIAPPEGLLFGAGEKLGKTY